MAISASSQISAIRAPGASQQFFVIQSAGRMSMSVDQEYLLLVGSDERSSAISLRKTKLSNWFERRMAPFVPGDMPDADTVAALDRFEADLTTLLKNSGVARVLKAIGIALPALAQDGSIRQRTELVMPSRNNERLALRKRFLLKDTRRATALNKILQTLSDPTIAMLLSTFDKDRENFDALQARLRQFLALTEPSDSHRIQLAARPILPDHGQPHAPQDLAFKGQRGDYWGDWKIRIYGKGLSQDDQQRYRDVGVTSASPTCETSRDFFEWLSRQDAAVLERHVNCVLRHILHRDGPENWAESFIATPFIPAKSSGGLRLVSLRQARRTPGVFARCRNRRGSD